MSLGAAGQPEVQRSFNHTQHTHANLDINMYISTAIQSSFYIFIVIAVHCLWYKVSLNADTIY